MRVHESYAKGSPNGSKFSVFFVNQWEKDYSLTDIDFVISNNKLLIEEKYFVENKYDGLLSEGQFTQLMNLLKTVKSKHKV